MTFVLLDVFIWTSVQANCEVIGYSLLGWQHFSFLFFFLEIWRHSVRVTCLFNKNVFWGLNCGGVRKDVGFVIMACSQGLCPLYSILLHGQMWCFKRSENSECLGYCLGLESEASWCLSTLFSAFWLHFLKIRGQLSELPCFSSQLPY